MLLEGLGKEFHGVLGCDYFSAYRRYLRACGVVMPFCLAPLIGDVKFLTTLPDTPARASGERLRESLRALFAVIHRREPLGRRVVGLDYSQHAVQLCVLDNTGKVLCNRAVPDSADAINQAIQRLGTVHGAAREACTGAVNLAEELADQPSSVGYKNGDASKVVYCGVSYDHQSTYKRSSP